VAYVCDKVMVSKLSLGLAHICSVIYVDEAIIFRFGGGSADAVISHARRSDRQEQSTS
jgi:hypothetical protein